MALTWGHLLSGQHIRFHCDNLQLSRLGLTSHPNTSVSWSFEDTLFHCKRQLHCVPCAPPRLAKLHCECPVTQPHDLMSHFFLWSHRYIDQQHHSPTDSRALEDHLQFLLTKAVAPSTSSTYKAGIQRYLSFCQAFLTVPFPWIKTV